MKEIVVRKAGISVGGVYFVREYAVDRFREGEGERFWVRKKPEAKDQYGRYANLDKIKEEQCYNETWDFSLEDEDSRLHREAGLKGDRIFRVA